MADALRITEVQFHAATAEAARTGFLGWVSLMLNGSVRLEGIALRRGADGRLALAFPRRRDGFGRRRYYVRPVDDRARRHIEAAVFHALGLEGCAGTLRDSSPHGRN